MLPQTISSLRLAALTRIMGGVLIYCFINTASAKDFFVTSQDEYHAVSTSLKPGDKIILAKGVWENFEILFQGQGTRDLPISLVAEEKGHVIISGESNLRLHGEHLFISGLVFKDGYTPTSAVISFRSSKDNYANNSRITEVVIDNFNNPERFENDSWVMMYGKHNRFDHSHLEGKSNKGVTMAVRMNSPESQENYHQIDHNYFGPRSILGSNGGETLRIGTSHHSLKNSYTKVENNYFDRCDGELEVISNKSGFNEFRANVFFESRGTMTLRHGNDNLMENNVFIGNGVDHTGGLRLINKRQTIRNNYLEGLAGYRFGGGLVIMNGVPNSPINRYHQVEDSVIENNMLVNVSHIQLAAGSDQERSAVPITSSFKNNLIYNDDTRDTFTVYDDVSGIEFAGNVLNNDNNAKLKDGFHKKTLLVKRQANGLMEWKNPGASGAGLSKALNPISKNDVGVSWYPKSDRSPTFGFGEKVTVTPGQDTLTKAIKAANDGDVLKLEAGQYSVSKLININRSLVIKGAVADKVKITYERGALFEIQDGGDLKLDSLTISGVDSPDSSGNTVVRTPRRSMLSNYELIIDNVVVEDLDINHTFNFLTVAKGTFADRIAITNSQFRNVSGAILKLDQENDDFGIYNAEYVDIESSTFESVKGAVVDLYRGGTDESTFGPHLNVSNSKFISVGQGKRNKTKSSIRIHGVQVADISNNVFEQSAGLTIAHTVAEPVTAVKDNHFANTPAPTVVELNSDKENTATISGNSFNNQEKVEHVKAN